MTRRTTIKTQNQELTALRRLSRRIDAAMEAAPPDKAVALLPRAMELAKKLADVEAAEAEGGGWTAQGQRDYDAEVEGLIRDRATELAETLLRPLPHTFENEARRLAWREGGAWEDQMDRVRQDHAAFVQRLLTIPRGVSFREHLEGEAGAGVLWARGW